MSLTITWSIGLSSSQVMHKQAETWPLCSKMDSGMEIIHPLPNRNQIVTDVINAWMYYINTVILAAQLNFPGQFVALWLHSQTWQEQKKSKLNNKIVYF